MNKHSTNAFCIVLLIGSIAAFESLHTIAAADLTIDSPSTADSGMIQLAPLPGFQYSPVVTAIAIDDENQILVAAGDDHAIRCLNLQTGQTIATLKAHSDWVRQMAFLSPVGDRSRLLSCGDDGQVILWTWTTAEPAKSVSLIVATLDHTLTALAIDESRQQFAVGGFSQDINLISTTDFKPIRTMQCDCGDQRSFVFSHDGRFLMAGGRDGAIHIFDTDEGSVINEYRKHRGRVRSLSLDASGEKLTSVGEDKCVQQFNWQTGEIIFENQLHTGKLLSLQILDDDRLVAAGADNTIQILDKRDGKILKQLVGHEGSVAVMLADDHYLITAGFDTTIRLWNMSMINSSSSSSNTITHPVRSQFFDSGVNEPTY